MEEQNSCLCLCCNPECVFNITTEFAECKVEASHHDPDTKRFHMCYKCNEFVALNSLDAHLGKGTSTVFISQ